MEAADRARLPLAVSPARIAIAGLALASALYAWLLFPWRQMNGYTDAQLQTVGRHLDRAYLPYDSGGYLDAGRQSFRAIANVAWQIHGLHFGVFSNVTLELLGHVALKISAGHPYIVIAVVNHLLLLWTLLHYRALAARYGVVFDRFAALMLVDPLVLFCMYTLNKEAIGLFLIAGMLRYAIERRWIRYAVLLVLSLFTRDVFFLFGALLLFLPFLYRIDVRGRSYRVPAAALLVAMSLLLPLGLWVTHGKLLGSEFGSNLDVLAVYFHQQTQRILSFAAHIDHYPFGYVLGWFLVTSIDIASPALNPRYWSSYRTHIDVAQLLLQLSSLAFIALLAFAFAARRRLRLFAIEPLRLFFVATLLTAVFPLSQHRYLLPFYPLLVLTCLIAMSRDARVAARS